MCFLLHVVCYLNFYNRSVVKWYHKGLQNPYSPSESGRTCMNASIIIAILKTKHPGCTIIKNDEQNPTEIICEIEPSTDHPEYSTAIAVIDRSLPHYHNRSTETYEVIDGELVVTVDGKEYTLKKGETFVIKPKSIHSAKGNETVVKVISKPGWTFEDHIIVK